MARSIEEINADIALADKKFQGANSESMMLSYLAWIVMLTNEKLDRMCEGEGIE